ncbi:PhoH family protein [bacterium]|nr:PhoH family protein [bacterium]
MDKKSSVKDRKSCMLDASVLLHDPSAFHHYKMHDIIVPGVVLEELDRKKSMHGEMGRNARKAMKFIDEQARKGDIQKGVALEKGGMFRILIEREVKKDSFISGLSPDRTRHRLLSSAHQLKELGHDLMLVSKDPVTKIIAETIGVVTTTFHSNQETYEGLYRGVYTVDVPKTVIDEFYKEGEISIPDGDYYPNSYLVLKGEENSSAVAKVNVKEKKLVPLLKGRQNVWGVKPRNVEQKCALDLLLRDEVKLVSFIGNAGTGKTLLALAAGLQKVFDDNVYNRVIIARSIMPLGKDIGFLPGSKEEKLQSWLAPFFDNLDFICESGGEDGQETKKWILESNKFQVEAITYMRGRSFSNAYIIIDEAQNLTPHELKTLISRVGENTKIVILGDPTQIDNPYLVRDSNGLVYTVGKMKHHGLFGSIYFQHTERSKLAALAAEVL